MKAQMQSPFYDLPSPDEKKKPKEGIPNLEGLLKKYEEVLELDYLEFAEAVNSIDQILEPEEINAFLQATIVFEDSKDYILNTGEFISKLIQNSYDKGYNNFILNTKSLIEIHSIGDKLEGAEKKPIEVTIEGNTKNLCGYRSKNAIFNIKGNTGEWCGEESKNSIFNIEGNAGGNCGKYSTNSTFKIKGNVGDYCGTFSKYSTYSIEGDVADDCGYHAENSTFNIEGNIGNRCGNQSEHTTYNINGNTESWFGVLSKYSTYNVKGNIGENRCGEGSNNSTFIVYNKAAYKNLLEKLPTTNTAIRKGRKDNVLKKKIRGFLGWGRVK